ncbi:MAG: DUF3524 domain-containing protein [Deltaproteobacteria bacterium]|nr:DUF3524 domain-containing protein [Deltaproteobacteria bacterium]
MPNPGSRPALPASSALPDPPALRVALLEPFWGGSHRASAEGWLRWSRHRVEVHSLPARAWKWRMRGAALALARRLGPDARGADVLFATDLMDLAHLRALVRRRVPAMLYFHENQASYPLRPGEAPAERDLQYALTNLASALAADRIAFNSAFQRDRFFPELERVLRSMPSPKLLWTLDELRRKTSVLPLGVELADIPPREGTVAGGPPLVLWNHRWEHDKAPEEFFDAIRTLSHRRIPFRLAVAGERYGTAPEVFARAREEFRACTVHWGFAPAREEYVRLLSRAQVVVSTARQENFGVSMVEAAYAGAHPLAPRRLAYPEVFPGALHDACLYDDLPDLVGRLEALLSGTVLPLSPDTLRAHFGVHSWHKRAPAFDRIVSQVSEQSEVWYK